MFTAAKLGNVKSIFNLGSIFEKGKIGLEPNIHKSIEYYEKSSQLGDVKSMFNLALIYENEETYNPLKAIKLYEEASKRGNTNAMMNLAYIYMTGVHYEVLKRDPKIAVNLLVLAANHNHPHALNNLAEIYERGDETIPKDLENSALYYKKSFLSFGNQNSYFKYYTIVNGGHLNWNTEYHRLWCFSQNTEPIIVTLLLISNFRSESSLSRNIQPFLVKGIVMILIKFLCNLTQFKKRDFPTN